MSILKNKIFNIKSNYYCLVAGLPEFSFESDGAVDVLDLRSQIAEVVTEDDAKSLELLYTFYDIVNIINAVDGGRLPFNKLGNLTLEQIEMEIEAPVVDDEPFATLLPSQIAIILDRYKGRVESEEGEDDRVLDVEQLQSELYAHYYKLATMSGCKFIRIYSAIDKQIRNIVAASRARVMGVDAVTMLVGDGELEQQILSSSAQDFGLRGEFEYFEQLWSVIETEDFVERERKMDALRWGIADDVSEGDYFGIDMLAGYLVKLNIMYRWQALDKALGRERFGQMVEGFTSGLEL